MKIVRVMISKLLLLFRWADVTSFRKYQVNNIIQPQDKFILVNSFSAVKAKINFKSQWRYIPWYKNSPNV